MEADISSQAVGLASSADFSLINLFIRADIIVKSVIIILIACSIYSWAVIIEKYKLFKKINQSTEEFETKFWNSKSAETFYNSLPATTEDPMAIFLKIFATSIKSNFIPISLAKAGRCSAALVDPPVAATIVAPFSKAFFVTRRRGRRRRRPTRPVPPPTSRPAAR